MDERDAVFASCAAHDLDIVHVRDDYATPERVKALHVLLGNLDRIERSTGRGHAKVMVDDAHRVGGVFEDDERTAIVREREVDACDEQSARLLGLEDGIGQGRERVRGHAAPW
jgi:hypothetical protein